MKKRFLALLLALTTLLSLFACAPDNTGSGSGEKPGITTEKDENGLLYVLSGETYTVVADTANAGKTAEAEEFTGVAYSLQDVLNAVNAGWADYSEEDQTTIREFLIKWAAFVTNETVAQLQTQLDKIFG